MYYYVKGMAQNGECWSMHQAGSVSEAIRMWEANAYNPKYVIEVREHDINGKKVY
jgi:hypothetical protein